MSYARHAFEAIIYELEERKKEESQYVSSRPGLSSEQREYRMGKVDSLKETISYIQAEFM